MTSGNASERFDAALRQCAHLQRLSAFILMKIACENAVQKHAQTRSHSSLLFARSLRRLQFLSYPRTPVTAPTRAYFRRLVAAPTRAYFRQLVAIPRWPMRGAFRGWCPLQIVNVSQITSRNSQLSSINSSDTALQDDKRAM